MNFLRRFHDIVSDQSKNFDEKIHKLLIFGLDVFNLDIAIISEIENSTYKVLYVITPDDSLTPETVFDLDGTYCVHTLTADAALTFHKASTSSIANHPCYLNFQLESYIGAPIKVGAKVFGTVNFSSPNASMPFTQEAHDYVELFAQWLGCEFARKIANEQLLKNNNTLLKLENVANIGSWEVDLVKDKIIWSEQTRRIHEVPDLYVPELDSAIAFFKVGNSRESISQAVESAIENGDKWHLELELTTANNKEIWVSTFGEAEFTNGCCIRLFGTLQDITESVMLREELKNKKAEAERMLEDRSMLLAKISHELRTPLNGITGMLTTLLDEHREEKRVEKLKVALRSADILLSIINEVLDFSKINHGELKLEPNHFLLKTIFVDLGSLYIPLFKDNKVNFQTCITIPDDCWAYCDNARLSQIVSNLLSNSLKFTEKGEVKFSADVSDLDDKYALHIEISDTGRGMTKPFLDSLFSPFTQEVDAKRSKGGTGLGLAIVKELIDYMNGTISVNSEFNSGTTFIIDIPLAVGEAQIEINQRLNVDIDATNLSVLVVDDNQINRFVLDASLEKLAIKADFAVDGEDAILKCKQRKYDLIFMDCVMPQLDGLEATKILRADNICNHESTLIVALTANTSSTDKVACKEAGMDMFISKPFKLHSIEDAVVTAIASKAKLIA
ncbi:response regulator [Pseudoalteromonas sp. NEC-BIFX-2020_002]|uniref:hybrid sensor histidine kinase/response regulator n=1 Tax=unclassified Pseudoalteromonas TaxID=194690 RepID=UPI0014615B3A|nr:MULTISPECIES: ATP-binding protein [unclassified Pseudoalteromonas]NMR26006.1 response regulator [Pseudoalteromonas sp. NEC-BIFX-2020_015]NNG45433.1 response regulator [Pseudoalteromonas sp. NEC-BIFX-2020_002]